MKGTRKVLINPIEVSNGWKNVPYHFIEFEALAKSRIDQEQQYQHVGKPIA